MRTKQRPVRIKIAKQQLCPAKETGHILRAVVEKRRIIACDGILPTVLRSLKDSLYFIQFLIRVLSPSELGIMELVPGRRSRPGV